LNPEALQSTAQVGIDATVQAAQQQIEMIARILAETGMRRVFDGILRLVKQHQDQARTVRLRNEWVPVDPSAWNAGMDTTVNTALGRGTDAQKLQSLSLIAEKQEQIFQTAGQVNPLVTPAEYRETLAQMVNIAGFPNADKFFLPVDHGKVMQQVKGQIDQLTQQHQQSMQQVAILTKELERHTQAGDNLKLAQAGKAQSETVKTLVETAQTGAGADVKPDAITDELVATRGG
jgi:hypothetical protein